MRYRSCQSQLRLALVVHEVDEAVAVAMKPIPKAAHKLLIPVITLKLQVLGVQAPRGVQQVAALALSPSSTLQSLALGRTAPWAHCNKALRHIAICLSGMPPWTHLAWRDHHCDACYMDALASGPATLSQLRALHVALTVPDSTTLQPCVRALTALTSLTSLNAQVVSLPAPLFGLFAAALQGMPARHA